MELVVVMVILMALAAIIVPIFPSLIERAHRASQGTNTSEITKAIQLYQSLNGTYPDGYDLLTDGSQLINYFPSAGAASPMVLSTDTANANPTNYIGFSYPAGGYVSTGPLTAGGLAALNGAGITTEYALLQNASSASSSYTQSSGSLSTGWQPTFNPYQGDSPTSGQTTLTTSTNVVYVNGSGIIAGNLAGSAVVSGSPTQFVLFGLGKRCSAIGTVISNPSYNFPNDAVHENPDQVYERFGLVFQLEDVNKNPLPSALFVGAVFIESNVLGGTDKVEESYIQNVTQQSAPASGPGI
jgi:type II secretory pathway pseudopilin PulG